MTVLFLELEIIVLVTKTKIILHFFWTVERRKFPELKIPLKMSIATNGAFITATKKGSLNVMSNFGYNGIIENVFYCPEILNDLSSVQRMQQAGMTITFGTKGVEITENGKKIIKGKSVKKRGKKIYNACFSINQ